MSIKQCVAMILAGGQGSRLGVLTKNIAKPAVPFGGKYKIIDFTLSNCVHSGIGTVGVLTQYQPLELNTYIGNGQPWDLDRNDRGVYVLPPYMNAERGEWYRGTANAIYQNIDFIQQFNPKYVLVLSGDHIYKMHYGKMLEEHIKNNADTTIAVIDVPLEEASRFGIMTTNEENRVVDFSEKPQKPKSTLASMGIYIFNWKQLKKYLIVDENNVKSDNDFGKNIIPSMINAGEKLYAYRFDSYWKDVGTIQSLWEANMDLIKEHPEFNLSDSKWRIFARNPVKPPHYVSNRAQVSNCLIAEGGNISGVLKNSVVFDSVEIGDGSVITDSIIFPNVKIGANVTITKAIIGSNTVISGDSYIGSDDGMTDFICEKICSNDISLIGQNLYLDEGVSICKNSMVDRDIVLNRESFIGKTEGKKDKKMIS